MKQCNNDLFNPALPTVMCVDVNSCFATVEQQANPLLRGKPVAVAAYTTPQGCILAASIEAKGFGVKTGMRVQEGKHWCPSLIVLPSDPPKYRFVNRQLLRLLERYTADVEVKSIDEMIVSFAGSPILMNRMNLSSGYLKTVEAMKTVAQDIKERIREEIGEWIRVSIGIAPNRYLAKVASGLHKPDGLDVISQDNIEEVLGGLELEDLCGIKAGYAGRLRRYGITSALDFYRVPPQRLVSAFRSIVGHHWWQRLHGYEIDPSGQVTKSVGHSYALYQPYPPSDRRLHQILSQLTVKMGRRLRSYSLRAAGIHVGCLFSDYSNWQRGRKLPSSLYANQELYQAALEVLSSAPDKPVRILSVTCYRLSADLYQQRSWLASDERKERLAQALDQIEDRFGDFTVFPARMLGMEEKVLDRIAFGGVKGLE